MAPRCNGLTSVSMSPFDLAHGLDLVPSNIVLQFASNHPRILEVERLWGFIRDIQGAFPRPIAATLALSARPFGNGDSEEDVMRFRIVRDDGCAYGVLVSQIKRYCALGIRRADLAGCQRCDALFVSQGSHTTSKSGFRPKVLSPLSKFLMIRGCSTAVSSLGAIG